jgi:hypothetical protein
MTRRRKRFALLLLGAACALVGCAAPSTSFDHAETPPAPDYDRSQAWLALPGRNGLERAAPAGLSPIPEADAPADVFFIHPTTTAARDVWNAPWDASDEAAPLNPAVLLGQASVFNGCCRIYAPRYRQATLPALGKSPDAVDLAYADVAAAFRQFIAHRNQGRPFILASHSQGTAHAIRLVQTEILGTPLQQRMVAAYLIGGYVPDAFPEIGLPVCDAPDQTGCVLTWNAGKPGARLARIVIDDKPYWWKGAVKTEAPALAVCVNPLTWRDQRRNDEAAPANLNPGSIPLPGAPFPSTPAPLLPMTPHLTGARCDAGMLEVDLGDAPAAYGDALTRLAGSYHLNDYGLFYGALRENAARRVRAWTDSRAGDTR